jgi:spermidine/putrescine transport system ATP-binding protein
VTVAVRPEKITISTIAPVAPDRNMLVATVREVVYAGAASTYLITGPGGEDLKVFSQNRETPSLEPNTQVFLSWSPAHTILVET